MRCQNCGTRNTRTATICERCQQPLEARQNNALDVQSGILTPENDFPGVGLPVPQGSTHNDDIPPEPNRRTSRRAVFRRPGRRPKSVSGEIIAQESAYSEPPGFNIFNIVTRLCWGVIFLGIPFIIFQTVWAILGAGTFILSIVILYFILRHLNPLNLLALLHLFSFFNPFHRREEQIPVRYFRLRDEAENEYVIRIKGFYKAGNIGLGDMVTFWGRWRDGVLFTRKGYNDRTRSKVRIRRDYSILAFSLSVAFTLFVVLICVSYYIPHQEAVLTSGY
ncbi:MAG: hypothetical protein Q6359_02110 [Candidatus Brocadiales bacterium]|nr:hypothetical protein [Candidatus Brocadiales bacterium]